MNFRKSRPIPVLLLAASIFAIVASGRSAMADLPVPAGLQPGDTYHLLFNSSTFTNALSSSIDYYNDFVQAAADAAGIGASEGVTWKAVASTASIDARVNALVGTNTPVYNTRAAGPQKIADGFSDMWDGSVDQQPAYDEFGIGNGVDPWTGSNLFGLRANGETLGHPNGVSWCGHPTSVDGNWLQFTRPPTWAELTVYALSEELTIPDADFNGDSDVDGDDFLQWQRGAGDADGNGSSDDTDLAYWQDQYGQVGASQSLAAMVVPEPSGVVLCVLGTSLLASRRGKR